MGTSMWKGWMLTLSIYILHATDHTGMIPLNPVHGGLSVRRFTCCVDYLKPLLVSWRSSELSDPTTAKEAWCCWPPASTLRPVGRGSVVNYCSPLSVRGLRLKLSPLMHPGAWQGHPAALLFELLTLFTHTKEQLNIVKWKSIHNPELFKC